jgi:hypothetical protein
MAWCLVKHRYNFTFFLYLQVQAYSVIHSPFCYIGTLAKAAEA